MADIPLVSPQPGIDRLARLRRSLFPTPLSGLVSLAGIALALWIGWALLQWVLLQAVFTGSAEDCRAASGACWAVVTARWRLMFFG
ncbi:MAG: hypothetical protein U5N10_03490, partial [Gemmobacter sp.]|nr:hypothetical protein [Gemmobacter sp.]